MWFSVACVFTHFTEVNADQKDNDKPQKPVEIVFVESDSDSAFPGTLRKKQLQQQMELENQEKQKNAEPGMLWLTPFNMLTCLTINVNRFDFNPHYNCCVAWCTNFTDNHDNLHLILKFDTFIYIHQECEPMFMYDF